MKIDQFQGVYVQLLSAPGPFPAPFGPRNGLKTPRKGSKRPQKGPGKGRNVTQTVEVSLRRCTLSKSQDPFTADDEVSAYRQRILGLVEDCLEVLTPNTALEHVLNSLRNGQQGGVLASWAYGRASGDARYMSSTCYIDLYSLI